MPHKGSHPLIRTICIVLWVLIVGILYYQNQALQTIIGSLQRSQSKLALNEGYQPDSPDDVAMELRTLIAANAIYRASLMQEHINLKECMSKLPQKEIDDFYRRHREELKRVLAR